MSGGAGGSARTAPVVRVVVVNFNGGAMTLRCLDSLAGLSWPADRVEVVLADNGSGDGIADRVAAERPAVRVVRNAANLGFGGGCNRGMGDLAGVDYVALLNNDAVVEPGWLAALVAAMEADPGTGGAAGKVLFAGRFAEVVLEAPTFVPGKGDTRRLGVRVSGLEVDGVDRWGDALFRAGFFGPERGDPPETSFRWTSGRATLLVPAPPADPAEPPADHTCRVRLASASPRAVTVRAGGEVVRADVGQTPGWVEVRLAGRWTDVVNSVGGVLLRGGHGADRGFLEPDDGRYDLTAEVFSWTGAAALLRTACLHDVGRFDERFFLYYEDLDLAWRARLRGWRHVCVPGAVAHHLHSATSGRTSPVLLHHLERNRLLALTRNAPAGLLARALLGFAWTTMVESGREVVNSTLIGNGPATGVLRQRAAVLKGYLRLLPGSVARRRGDGRRLRVGRAEVVRRWASER